MIDGHAKTNMMTAIEFVATLPMSGSMNKSDCDEQKAAGLIKHQLIERKELHFRRRHVNDIMCLIAVFGILLMVIDAELRFNEVDIIIIILIRPLISISTVILVGLVFYYHAIDFRLYAINNHIADWRVTLSIPSIFMILCEVVVCAVHPFPTNNHKMPTGSGGLEMSLTLPSK
jgi:hypothetical protein